MGGEWMKAVYEATYEIPELGAKRGDLIVVRPADPHAPLLVVREFDRNRLPIILDHLHRLPPVRQGDPAPPPSLLDVRRQLESRLRRSYLDGPLRLVR